MKWPFSRTKYGKRESTFKPWFQGTESRDEKLPFNTFVAISNKINVLLQQKNNPNCCNYLETARSLL